MRFATLCSGIGAPEVACDGPRYKALDNSMAVPCVEFILRNLKETQDV